MDVVGTRTAWMTMPKHMFDGLFDDAALFPPGSAPMIAAIPSHRALTDTFGALVGPFVVPADRLDELSAHIAGDAPVDLSVIASVDDLSQAIARVAADPRLRIAAVEIPRVTDAATARHVLVALDDAALGSGVSVAIELPRTAATREVLDLLAGSGYKAKLRTGGVQAAAFPEANELADTISACVERGVAIKCTAGLHHAACNIDPAIGFRHHGFLNVLLAASAAGTGADAAHLVALLREADVTRLADTVRSWSPEQAAAARSIFTSFGTCSVHEPIDDLAAVGLLPTIAATRTSKTRQ